MMSIDLSQIATQAVDALTALKGEMDVLQARMKSAEEKRASVADAVYLRVMSDYRERLHGLESQAAPLRNEVRMHYAKLASMLNALDEETGSINLDREEVEFRHQLGEFDKKAYQAKIAALDARAGEKSGLITKAEELKKRFLATVSHEHELLSDHKPSMPPAETKAKPALSTSGEQTTQRQALPVVNTTGENTNPSLHIEPDTSQIAAVPGATGVNALPSMPPLPAGALGNPSLGNPGATMVLPAMRPGSAPGVATVGQPQMTPGMAESTVVMRAARLVPQNPEAGKTTHVLGVKPMQMGADSACEIRIQGPGVEAKHATITPQSQGYVLKDWGSTHGTRINAVKITEQLLDHEDVIQIGAARFVFRLG